MKRLALLLLIIAILLFSLLRCTSPKKPSDTAEAQTTEKSVEEQSGKVSDASAYRGKVISILGDSISTYEGWIPTADGFNREHVARYPQEGLLTDVTDTWWMRLISELGAKLGVNDSWSGSMISGSDPVTTRDTGENAAFGNLTRIRNLGSNGTPDVILVFGGTNDYAHMGIIGVFDPSLLPEDVDLTTKSWTNLPKAYAQTLLRLRYYYPDALIVSVLPACTAKYYNAARLDAGNAILSRVCEHYGVPYVDLRGSGLGVDDLPDGIHPNAAGMKKIADAVFAKLLTDCPIEPGENVVYSVTHILNGAESTCAYVRGVSVGEPFETEITGAGVTVAVTMGGEDVTDAVYLDGAVVIPSVTGDLVIAATGTAPGA